MQEARGLSFLAIREVERLPLGDVRGQSLVGGRCSGQDRCRPVDRGLDVALVAFEGGLFAGGGLGECVCACDLRLVVLAVGQQRPRQCVEIPEQVAILRGLLASLAATPTPTKPWI